LPNMLSPNLYHKNELRFVHAKRIAQRMII